MSRSHISSDEWVGLGGKQGECKNSCVSRILCSNSDDENRVSCVSVFQLSAKTVFHVFPCFKVGGTRPQNRVSCFNSPQKPCFVFQLSPKTVFRVSSWDAVKHRQGETAQGGGGTPTGDRAEGSGSSMMEEGEMGEVEDDGDGGVRAALGKRPAPSDGGRAAKRSPARGDASDDDESLLGYEDALEGIAEEDL